MAANVEYDVELSKLKCQICDVLSANKGVEVGSFWNHFIKQHCTLPDPKKFKVTKRSDLLELCSDVIEITGSGNTAKLSLKTPAQTPATDSRRDGGAKHTGLAAAKKKTTKTGSSSDSTAVKENTIKSGSSGDSSSGDSSLEIAVGKLELNHLKMQPGFPASFYDKFYAASTPQSGVSAAGSHQKDNIAKENARLPSTHKRDGSSEGHRVHIVGSASALVLPGSGNVPNFSGIRQHVPSVYTNQAQSGGAIHRGFSHYGTPFADQPAALNAPHLVALGHQTALGPKDSPSCQSMSGSWQQFTQNAMYHKVTNQPPTVRSNPISTSSVANDTSYRPTSSATGGRKMNFSKQQIVSAAEDCIDRLSAAKDFVSLEKIEKLLLQHFEVDSLQQLNLRHLEELPCVNEHVRLVCKVNTYIQNFIKVRTVCTVFELHEALREFATNRGDFDSLKIGPLTKLPLIYEYFKFPPDADICEITTADVIEDLRLYLTEKNAWTAQLNLEELLKFMMEKRGLTTPYELGLRIKSPALAIQMLKKAQRDCGQTVRSTAATLSQALERELDAAFRNFQVAVMRKEADLCLIREEYCSMSPRDLLRLVFTKLRQMYQMVFNIQISWDAGNQGVTMSAAERKKHHRTLELLNNFITHLTSDELLQKLFKVAVCCSQEQIHNFDFVREKPSEQSIDVDTDDDDISNLNLPHIGVVIKDLRKYLERVVAQGSITLDMLAKIEQKLLSEYNLKYFTLLQQGSFLEFLLGNEEFKKILDEHGGSLTGSSSHSGLAESIYHAAVDDLVEFMKQCATKEVAIIETAVCHHYGCKEVKALGHGSVGTLLNKKRQHQQGRDSAVFYDSALAAKQMSSVHGQLRNVGVLGHTTREKALACLQNCPLLADMAEFSHWDMVFKPQLKDLKDFIQKHGFVFQCSAVDGARNVLVTTDLIALEVRPGTLLRLTTSTSPEIFESKAIEGDARSTAGHLMSLIAQSRGVEEAPLVLLGNHVKTALLTMQSRDTDFSEDMDESRLHPHILFVLNCLTFLPLATGHLVIKKVFLDALSDVVGQARSKQLLLQHARSVEQRTKLQAFGMLLGIQEWTESFQLSTVFPKQCMEAVAVELGPIVQTVHQSDSEDDSESGSEMEMTLSDDSDEDEDDLDSSASASSMMKTSVKENAVVVEVVTEELTEEMVETSTQKMEEQKSVIVSGSESLVIDVDSNSDMVSISIEESSMSPSRQFIDLLRHEEFGVNVELSDDGKRLMNKQHERLGRSLERLSADLYSKDTHFVLELIQNADDNEYYPSMLERDAQDRPSLRFSFDPGCITVFNNETGFTEKNIRAVCDVGKTTKGKHKFGYIGQKGIGFKSVFRVTECPEIHSNGFHIKFDVNSGPLGYILPHWIEEDDVCKTRSSDKWTTCICLPLRSEMQQRAATKTLAARFRDIQPSLLLFLHRLRSIEICNKMESYASVMTRRDISDNIVEITHSGGCDRWLVVRKMLDASKISLQAKSGVEIESTELALAFPLLPKTNLTSQILPPKQPVFAFLPLRSYGFRFIVQADFDVPSSREEVDRDSMWNQWLRSEIAMVFVSALDSFKELKQFDAIEAIARFLHFVPLEGEILDFFTPVAASIFQHLRAKSCLPTQGLQWRLPSQLVVTSDPMVREVVSGALLRQCLNLDYLHSGVAAILNSQMMHSLGVQTLNTQHLLEVGKQIVSRLSGTVDGSNDMLNDVGLVSVSKWLLCLHKSMDEFGRNEDTLKCLRSMRMIPLSSGCVTSIDNDTVFFPLSMFSDKREILSVLEADMQIVHPLLLGNGGTVNSQICSLLEQLGVKRLMPRDVISHHILPILRTDAWKSKSRELVVAYMMYIMEQCSQQSSIVNMDELRPLAVVLTNVGFVRPAELPVHFTPEFGNSIDLAKLLPGFEWTLIDRCYISDVRSRLQIQEWRKFLSSLGVLDFLAVKQQDVTLTRAELSESVWSDYATLLPAIEEYKIADYQCEEFATLVELNTNRSTLVDRMKNLFQLMNQSWESQFKRFSITKIMDKAGHMLREVETSFSRILKKLPWIPATVRHESCLLRGSELFLKTQQASRLLASHIPFLFGENVSLIAGSSFCSFLGIRSDINVEFMAECLKSWCHRESAEKHPAKFSTSLAHMRAVYEYLRENMPPVKFKDLVENHPVIFYVDPVPSEPQSVSTGMFLLYSEVVWLDPSCLFSKYHESLVAVSPLLTNSLCRYILQPVYPDKERFFCNEMGIQRKPDASEFLKLVMHIASTCTVQSSLSDILNIFAFIGKDLTKDSAGTALAAVKKHLDQLKTEPIIPTKAGIWVKLTDSPMIADNKKLEKLFSEQSAVYFVDYGEKIHVGSVQGKAASKDAREYILKFLGEIGVRRLTECVQIEPQTENFRPCPGLQAYVRQMVPWIQRCLYADEFREIYDFLVASDIKARLAAMTFAQVGRLDLVHRLSNLPDVKPIIFEEKCRMISDSELDVHFEHVSSYSEINRELSRYFSCLDRTGCPCPQDQTDKCFRELKLVLGELQPLVSLPSDQLDAVMQQHEYGALPKSEELWEVKEPIVYGQPRVVKEWVELERSDTPMEVSSIEESSGIRSWPPKSHENMGLVHGVRSNTPSSGGSTMWPPPAPLQGMDRSQLPANLRPSTLPRPFDPERNETDQPRGSEIKTERSPNQHARSMDADDDRPRAVNKLHSVDSSDQCREKSVTVVTDNQNDDLSCIKRSSDHRVENDGKQDAHELVSVESDRSVSDESKKNIPMNEGIVTMQPAGDELMNAGVGDTAGDNKPTVTHVAVNPSVLVMSDISTNLMLGVGDSYEEPMVIEFTRSGSGDGAISRAGNKRARVNSDSNLTEIIKQPFVKQPVTIYGPPIWLSEVEECVYEQLGCGEALAMPTDIILSEDSDTQIIGQWGELLVNSYLQKLCLQSHGEGGSELVSFVWTNQETQKGLPYDFELVYRDNSRIYVEVKSTRSDQKACFGISIQQVMFAQEMGARYHLYRVYCAGDTKNVRLASIDNVAQRLISKQLRLFMAL